MSTLDAKDAEIARELAGRNLKVSDLLIENEARNAAIYHLNRKLTQAKDVLIECEEYFEQRADAESFPDSAAPRPNEEMKLLMIVRSAIMKAELQHEDGKRQIC